jgi:hypothetical protein
MIDVKCPVCKQTIIVGFNGKIYGEDENLRTIRKHWRSHSIGELMDFMEENMIDQLLVHEASFGKNNIKTEVP